MLPATAPGRDEQDESFGYYPGGQIGEARNEHARLLWFYDAAGNLIREQKPYRVTETESHWEAEGILHGRRLGGTFKIHLAKEAGQALLLIHSR